MTRLYSQNGDPLLFNSNDGGEIIIKNGVVQLSYGLENAAYLSLFGGNYDDDGRKDNALNWWGNLDENQSDRVYRSETQNLLCSLLPIPFNLIRISTAAKNDLDWMISSRLASDVLCETSMPAQRQIQFDITIEAVGESIQFSFVTNWLGSS